MCVCVCVCVPRTGCLNFKHKISPNNNKTNPPVPRPPTRELFSGLMVGMDELSVDMGMLIVHSFPRIHFLF